MNVIIDMTMDVKQGFGKDELVFIKSLPEHVEIECPVCLQVMLTDPPHIVSCCGHHFCATCIERVKASDGPCPMCKEINYQAVIDKNTLRIINGLKVYCTNKKDKEDCQWKGDLKNLPYHLNKGERDGECQFEEVKCRYEKCSKKRQRHYLSDHEKNDCTHRPKCQYCGYIGHLFIPKKHYEECPHYPVSCPNLCECVFPRFSYDTHLSKECPLQPIECPFSWAGCTDKPLRKDSEVHSTDPKHMSMLAVECGQLKLACGQLKKECNQLKNENSDLKNSMQNLHSAVTDDLPVLPVTIKFNSPPIHVYTHMFGHHISIAYGYCHTKPTMFGYSRAIYLAFHEGKFDKLQPKLPKISMKFKATIQPLLENTKAVYKKSYYNVLNMEKSISSVHQVSLIYNDIPSIQIFISWD